MKTLYLKISTAVFVLASVFGVAPAAADHVVDHRVLGQGTLGVECIFAFAATDCAIELNGQASGTGIVGHDDFKLTLIVDSLSQRLINKSGHMADGLCVLVAGNGSLTSPTTGASLLFNATGIVCEENGMASPAHFNGTYRISGGTAQFANAAGGGSVAATYARGLGGIAFLHLHGVIKQ